MKNGLKGMKRLIMTTMTTRGNIMGDVISINRKTPATDREKAQVFLRILKVAGDYIQHAQNKGVYDGWKYPGTEICNLISRMVLENEVSS